MVYHTVIIKFNTMHGKRCKIESIARLLGFISRSMLTITRYMVISTVVEPYFVVHNTTGIIDHRVTQTQPDQLQNQ